MRQFVRMRWYSTKQSANESRQPNDKYLIAKDVNTKGAKWFAWVSSHQDMFTKVFDPSPIHRHFYECTAHDLPCPLFFDIDGTGDMSKLDSILEQLVCCVRATNEYLWPGQVTFDDDDVYMSECNRGNVLSVHMVIRAVHVRTRAPLVFANPFDMKRYYMVLNSNTDMNRLPEEVDQCVARVGCFRLLGSSKLRERSSVSLPMRTFPRTVSNDEFDAVLPPLEDFKNRSVTYVPDNTEHYDLSVEDITIRRQVKLRRLTNSVAAGHNADDEPDWTVPEDSFAMARMMIYESLTDDMMCALDDLTNDVIDIVASFPNATLDKFSDWIKIGRALKSVVAVHYHQHEFANVYASLYTSIWHSSSQRSIKYSYDVAQQAFEASQHDPNITEPVQLLFTMLISIDKRRATILPCACTFTNMRQADIWNWVYARISPYYVVDPAFGLFSLNTPSNLWTLSSKDESPIVREIVSGRVYTESSDRVDAAEKRVREKQAREIAANPAAMGKAIKDADNKMTYYRIFIQTVQSEVTLRRVTKLLTQPGFGSTLDKDPYTITFTNCIYHLVTGTLRPIKPEDRVKSTVGYPYSHPTQAQIDEVEHIFREIIYSDSVFEWVMCYMSTCLLGIYHENMVFFTGMPEDPSQNGSNGKSTFMNWIMKAIGDYACRLQGTALSTSDFNAPNAHTSHLMPLVGSRAAYVVEIPVDMKLDLDSMIKPVTGGDPIKIRGLCKEEIEVVVPATLFATCNSLPDVRSRDHATWRRLRAVWFRRWFCDERDRDPNNPLHAPKVDNLHTDEKANTMRMATITLLIRYLTKYINNGMKLPPCPEVDQSTADFRDSTDTLKDFLESNFERGTAEDIEHCRSWVTFKEMKDIAQRKRFAIGRDRDFRNQVKHYYNLEWEDRVRVRSRHTNEMEFQRQRKRNVMVGVSPIFNDTTVES